MLATLLGSEHTVMSKADVFLTLTEVRVWGMRLMDR